MAISVVGLGADSRFLTSPMDLIFCNADSTFDISIGRSALLVDLIDLFVLADLAMLLFVEVFLLPARLRSPMESTEETSLPSTSSPSSLP